MLTDCFRSRVHPVLGGGLPGWPDYGVWIWIHGCGSPSLLPPPSSSSPSSSTPSLPYCYHCVFMLSFRSRNSGVHPVLGSQMTLFAPGFMGVALRHLHHHHHHHHHHHPHCYHCVLMPTACFRSRNSGVHPVLGGGLPEWPDDIVCTWIHGCGSPSSSPSSSSPPPPLLLSLCLHADCLFQVTR